MTAEGSSDQSTRELVEDPPRSTSHGGTTCPQCGAKGSLHRRHTRGFVPVFMKLLSSRRRYFCMNCKKTIWMHSHSKPGLKKAFSIPRSVIWVLILVVLSLLLARWIVG